MRSMQVSSLPLDGVSATSIRSFSRSVWTQLYWKARVRLIMTDLSGMVSMAVAVFVIVFFVCASNHCTHLTGVMCLWTFRVVFILLWIIFRDLKSPQSNQNLSMDTFLLFICFYSYLNQLKKLQPPFPDYLHCTSHIVMTFVCKKFHFPGNAFEKESSKIPSNWIN